MVRISKAKQKTMDASKDWKTLYQKQKLLLNSLMSLLNKYGASQDINHLYRELLLTVMGQFLAKNACYYTLSEDGGEAVPVLAFGSPSIGSLPKLSILKGFLAYIADSNAPLALQSIPRDIEDLEDLRGISRHFRILAPLLLKGRLIGFVALGERITGEKYSDSDYELLRTFCDVSAITFSNAKLLKNARVSLDEVQRLVDLRTEMISRITHEFRTPITVMKTGLLSLKLKDDHKKVKSWILESLDRLENLIQSLLELGEENLDESLKLRKDFDVLEAITGLIAEYSEEASNNGIQLKLISPSSSSLPKIKIDKDTFKKIVGNVIDNALKFSKAKSPVTLEFEVKPRRPEVENDGIGLIDWKLSVLKTMTHYRKLAHLDDEPDNASGIAKEAPKPRPKKGKEPVFLVLKVKDSGIGIPEDELDYITEPFRQASNSPDLGVRGKGLGLAVTQKLLALHGGLLYCKSRENDGTTFTLFFPVVKDSGYR